MKKLLVFLLATFCMLTTGFAAELRSPDGRIAIQFTIGDVDATTKAYYPDGTPYYAVTYDGKPFLLPSRMGFELSGTAEIKHYLRLVGCERTEHRNSWKPVYGEQEQYPDNYNEMVVRLEERLYPHRHLLIRFRAYDEGIAFRYEIPDEKGFESVTLTRELTEFTFPRNTSVWESHGHEGRYYKVYPYEVRPRCELPLTCLTQQGVYGALMEAGNHHYPRAYVEAPYGRSRAHTLRIDLRGEAKSTHGMTTAWRAITLSDTPGGLMERNYLLYNLNEPCKIADTSWIKPGTAMRDTELSTPSALRMIDYCASMGISYVIFDGGWYGKPNDHTSDPALVRAQFHPVTGAPKPNHPGLDLQQVIDYGKQKGVGIFLYVNREGLERYADQIFPLYQKWGIKGIKPGFVQVGSQEWQEWIERLVAKAAEYELLVNIHDAYRPNGFSRTYPNLLTQEGIHGNEQVPNADHNVMLPYTRFTSGAGDYTPGYTRDALQPKHIHRLALPVLYYSPAQFLFWIEKINDEHNRPELEFWRNIPTTWDETRFLSGNIGEYAIVARRKASTWYVGGITNTQPREVEVDCSFLTPGMRYVATLYTEGQNDTVDSKQITLDAKQTLRLPLQSSGGFTLKITPKK